jgi:hypothetical protein
MERIGRPEDDFREKLTEGDVRRICKAHGLPRPTKIVPEYRGNETVCYHLDTDLFLAFVIGEEISWKVGALSLLDRVKEIPTPRVVAWSDNDLELGVPYMIVERCPGHRLDVLWKNTTSDDHANILEALGVGTGRYHTVSAVTLTDRARSLGLGHRVGHIKEPKSGDDSPTPASLLILAAGLQRIGIEMNSLLRKLEAHFSRTTRERWDFIAPGLVHTEPFAEHFFIQSTRAGYRLSGCVDLNFGIRDAIGEITSH